MSNLEIFEKSHFEDLFQLAFVVCLPRYLALSGWVVKGKLLQGRNTNRNPAQIPKEDRGGSRFLISTMWQSSVTCIWSFCPEFGKILAQTVNLAVLNNDPR